jgi:hypothetical protein
MIGLLCRSLDPPLARIEPLTPFPDAMQRHRNWGDTRHTVIPCAMPLIYRVQGPHVLSATANRRWLAVTQRSPK